MGVPAFFRWLSRKYPSIVVQCDDGVKGQYHFDNLYLDMNGIIHPCSHPENKPPPANEDEMFKAIFKYIEDIMQIVKPKKLLYMAVDGVAPRAKMNQQRSRRFRAAQESHEKMIEVQKVKDDLKDRGIEVKENEKVAHFDSNVITPGTEFMINLSDALKTWINRRLSKKFVDKRGIWPKDLVIILSDASVPGEGEHKIMDYIRKQKADSMYNPNLSHCLYGADADLIMLGLATHEPHFTILREAFKPDQPRPCDLCGQLGHELKDCKGQEEVPKDCEGKKVAPKGFKGKKVAPKGFKGNEMPPEDLPISMKTEFIKIRLNILREYLEKESQKCAVKLDLERFIDDFVFFCFFVGNDFLPHLPSLEIRENAIDRLINIYKHVMKNVSDSDEIYLTKSGHVNKKRVQCVLIELGKVEDKIFKLRQRNDNKRKKMIRNNENHKWLNRQAVSSSQKPGAFKNAKVDAFKMRTTYNAGTGQVCKTAPSSAANAPNLDIKSESDSEPEDLIQLHTEGWKERYYMHKFDCNSASETSRLVANEYFKGLCWVLLYYYQGCPDWKWFFPYHYAPFASDFHDVEQIPVEFDGAAKPFRPMEQLMSVFPAASSKSLPPSWGKLMTSNTSPIIDFYPTTFRTDLNGKKAAWMGVVLLPFIDEDRLFKALKEVYKNLTKEEILRNCFGAHLIFVSKSHPLLTTTIQEVNHFDKSDVSILQGENKYKLVAGKLNKSKRYSTAYKNILCCEFSDPQYKPGFTFSATLLAEAKIPPPVLKPNDLNQFDNYGPQIGMNRRQIQCYLDHDDYDQTPNYRQGRGKRHQQKRSNHGGCHNYNDLLSGYGDGGNDYQSYNRNYRDQQDRYLPKHQQQRSNYANHSYYQPNFYQQQPYARQPYQQRNFNAQPTVGEISNQLKTMLKVGTNNSTDGMVGTKKAPQQQLRLAPFPAYSVNAITENIVESPTNRIQSAKSKSKEKVVKKQDTVKSMVVLSSKNQKYVEAVRQNGTVADRTAAVKPEEQPQPVQIDRQQQQVSVDVNALHPTVASLFSNHILHHKQNPRLQGATFHNTNYRNGGGGRQPQQQYNRNNTSYGNTAAQHRAPPAEANTRNNFQLDVSLNHHSSYIKQFIPLQVAQIHQHARTSKLKQQQK